MAEMADTAALREENAKLRARLEALQLQYDDVREEGKITTIYDNEKGVCIHVPDDTGPCTGRSTGPERAQNEPNNEPNNQPHTGPPRLSWAGFKQAT